MKLKLQELQDKDKHVWKFRAEQQVKNDRQEIDGVLYHQGLFYIPEIIRTKLISRWHDNLLAGYFVIKKTHKVVA